MATTPPTRRSGMFATANIALLLAMSGAVLLHASDRPGDLNAFLPMYATAAFLCDAMTAYLLSIQFINSRQLSVGLIAAAYAFSAPITMLQLSVLPGVFSATGLFHAGPQAAIWLWTVWHIGFPTFILLAMASDWHTGARPIARRSFIWVASATLIVPPLLAVILGWRVLALGERLDALMVDGQYDALLHHPVGILVAVMSLAALFAVGAIGRWRSILNVWLSVAVLCAVLDVMLTLAVGARYALGWYASRVLSVATAALLLIVTLYEINQLYARLSHSNRRLADLASHDGLTGTRNRRHFDLAIKDELRRAQKNKTQLALIICDVDRFKRFNDAFGHLRGDEALIAVARALDQQSRRGIDVVARYGGEEFAVILPGMNERGARSIAERLRQAVTLLAIETSGRGARPLSISLGIALLETGDSVETLIGRADQALYVAKREGRDRVVMAEGKALKMPAALSA